MNSNDKFEFFTYDEVKRVSDDVSRVNPGSLARLDAARKLAGIPFHITSAHRSEATEYRHGRSGTSAHCSGRAFDILCRTSRDRYAIVSAAVKVGFTRIGIAPSFIHLDDSPAHDQSVIWLY